MTDARVRALTLTTAKADCMNHSSKQRTFSVPTVCSLQPKFLTPRLLELNAVSITENPRDTSKGYFQLPQKRQASPQGAYSLSDSFPSRLGGAVSEIKEAAVKQYHSEALLLPNAAILLSLFLISSCRAIFSCQR